MTCRVKRMTRISLFCQRLLKCLFKWHCRKKSGLSDIGAISNQFCADYVGSIAKEHDFCHFFKSGIIALICFRNFKYKHVYKNETSCDYF